MSRDNGDVQELQQGLAAGGTNLSTADLIQLCGALAVELTGGPSIPVQLGRQDASQPDSDDQLPNPDMQPAQLQQLFSILNLADLPLCASSTLQC
ncbi:hypothetical protein WJX74_000393 [Apatococcus lobatus]|uniref:Plant heme peroxidase family profile domain-containing protein n=1 Tax=Apatococcus lobatus TaxID=904363 RepID=A0AAW1QHA6_9CHLO